MLLMQSSVVTDRVQSKGDSTVQRLVETYKDDNGRIVDELFLGTLSRAASNDERQIGLAAMAKDRVQGAQNLQWALLNQVEFLFNH
jgi:hypothetical protein